MCLSHILETSVKYILQIHTCVFWVLHLPVIEFNGRFRFNMFPSFVSYLCGVVSWVFMILPIVTRTFPSQAPPCQNLPCAGEDVHWIYCTWYIFTMFLLHLVVTKPIRLGKMQCKSCSTLWLKCFFFMDVRCFFGSKTFGVVEKSTGDNWLTCHVSQ